MWKVLSDILALVEELSHGTIDTVPAKSDKEPGRDILLGKIRPPEGMDVIAILRVAGSQH